MLSCPSKQILVVPFFEGGNLAGSADRKSLKAAIASLPSGFQRNVGAVIGPATSHVEALKSLFAHVPESILHIPSKGYPVTSETLQGAIRKAPEMRANVIAFVPAASIPEFLAARQGSKIAPPVFRDSRVMILDHEGPWKTFSVARQPQAQQKPSQVASSQNGSALLVSLLAGTSLSTAPRRQAELVR